MSFVPAVVSFAEQRVFAAKVTTRENEGIKWSMREITNGQRSRPRRCVRQRRTRDDGREAFTVTFFDGDKQKKTDLLAMDARLKAEFEADCSKDKHIRHHQRERRVASKPRSEPCIATVRRGRNKHRRRKVPFRASFLSPPKGEEMRMETARDQLGFFKPRSGTVPLSPTGKRVLRKWGIDVDAFVRGDGSVASPWVKAVGNTNNKWSNSEMAIRAAKDAHDFLQSMPAPESSTTKQPRPGVSNTSVPRCVCAKDLPPVRHDGPRRQLARVRAIPSSKGAQRSHLEGGMDEDQRKRRIEEQERLLTRSVVVQPGRGVNAKRVAECTSPPAPRRFGREGSSAWAFGAGSTGGGGLRGGLKGPSDITPAAQRWAGDGDTALCQDYSRGHFLETGQAVANNGDEGGRCCGWDGITGASRRGDLVPRNARDLLSTTTTSARRQMRASSGDEAKRNTAVFDGGYGGGVEWGRVNGELEYTTPKSAIWLAKGQQEDARAEGSRSLPSKSA